MQTKIMSIFTRTPLHVGCGSSVGAVDQPVVRERHTGYPVIPGSAIKGVLADLWNEPKKQAQTGSLPSFVPKTASRSLATTTRRTLRRAGSSLAKGGFSRSRSVRRRGRLRGSRVRSRSIATSAMAGSRSRSPTSPQMRCA